MKRHPPPGGYPWELPGYTFTIGWPVGFVPEADARSSTPQSQAAAAARQKFISTGTSNWNGKPKPADDIAKAAIKAGRPKNAAIDAQVKKWGLK